MGKHLELDIIVERRRAMFEILHGMASYWELTRFSEKVEGAPENPQWDKGFQAAMAIARGILEKETK